MFESIANARRLVTAAACLSFAFAASTPSSAQSLVPLGAAAGVVQPAHHDRDDGGYEAVVPVVQGWYDGQIALYLSTDSSRRDVSRLTHTNFVGRLSGAISGNAVDDIYQLTNFKQGNIIPSAPLPAGPENTDPNYTPLWQLSLVTWVAGQPHILKSEAAVLAEKAAGHVQVVKTQIVINCPVIFTPHGGLLYGIRIVR